MLNIISLNNNSNNKTYNLKVKTEIPRTANAFLACGKIKTVSEMYLQRKSEQIDYYFYV